MAWYGYAPGRDFSFSLTVSLASTRAPPQKLKVNNEVKSGSIRLPVGASESVPNSKVELLLKSKRCFYFAELLCSSLPFSSLAIRSEVVHVPEFTSELYAENRDLG